MRALKQDQLTQDSVHRVAVILNANAKQVTPRVQQRLERECEGMDIYYSRSMEDAWRIVRRVVEHGYHTVLTGGGDGTIIQTLNTLYQLTGRVAPSEQLSNVRPLRAPGAPTQGLPAIGILKLGTGNALATVVGAHSYSQDAVTVRKKAQTGQALQHLSLPLMEADGEVFPFGGLGWDAAVLNDYITLKNRFAHGPVQPVFKSALGYLVTALGVTAPRVVQRPMPEVEVRALAPATQLNLDGSPGQRFSRGDLLFRGRVNMAAFATVQYYGCKFRLFPFAQTDSGRFHLRLVTTPLSEVVAHLPQVWAGTYRSQGFKDFHCDAVELIFNQPTPYHIGGDARGLKERLVVGMNPHRVDLVDYRTAVTPWQNPVLSLLPKLGLIS